MKKIIRCLVLFFSFLILTSCEFGSKNSKEEKNPIDNQNEVTNIKSILSTYKNLNEVSIKEKTSAVDMNGNTILSARTSNLCYPDKYVSSKISHNGKQGFVKYVDGSYYYQLNKSGHKVYYSSTNDIYESIGISTLFDLDYTVKNNEATVFLTNFEKVSSFDNLFQNVNMDFELECEYNGKSFLTITIQFNKDSIDKITIDLSYVFGSYFKEITRTIEFDNTKFEKEKMDLSSGDKYYVNTAESLDTYVIELVYQYGDAIYIKSGDFDMLIDAGQPQDGQNVNKILSEYCTDHVLDMMIVTHGHADHIGGFSNGALSSIEDITLIVDYGYTSISDYYYEKYREYYDSDYYSAYDCINLMNGASKIYRFSEDLSIEILDTGNYQETGTELHKDCSDENEHSVVCKLTYKDNTYLYTGDISGDYESNLKKENIENMTVYKAAHHGAVSHNTNSQTFLNYVNPEMCVISAAIVNQNNLAEQFHPTPQFLQRILKTSFIKTTKNVYYNGTMGTIHLNDNGKDLPTVSGFGATRGYYIDGNLVTGEENKKITETYFYKNR